MENKLQDQEANQSTIKKLWRRLNGKRKKPTPILDTETTKRLWDEISKEREDIAVHVKKNNIKGTIGNDEDITADFQRGFAGKLFKLQSARAKEAITKGYFADVKSWQNSTSGRTRLVILEATKDTDIKAFAKTIFNASPLERVLVAGITPAQQKDLREELRLLWKAQAHTNRFADLDKQVRVNFQVQTLQEETMAMVNLWQSLLGARNTDDWFEKNLNRQKAAKLVALQEAWVANHADEEIGQKLQSLREEWEINKIDVHAIRRMNAFWEEWASTHASAEFGRKLESSWNAWAINNATGGTKEDLGVWLRQKKIKTYFDGIPPLIKKLEEYDVELKKPVEKEIQAEKEPEESQNRMLEEIGTDLFVTDKSQVDRFQKVSEQDIDQKDLQELMGPHLLQQDLDISYDTMSKRFPQFGTNISEILCFGESSALVGKLSGLGRKINSGIPIFSVRSKPLQKGEDLGLWRCASQKPAQFLAEITQGKNASELLGLTTQGGFDNVNVSEHFQDFFDMDKMSQKMKDYGIAEDVIEELPQEDLDYIKLVFYNFALYNEVKPDDLEVLRSKSKSLQNAKKSEDVARSLLWNIVERPVSTALEVIYGLGLMALGGGGDIASEDLKKRNSYRLFFEELLATFLDKKISPKDAIPMALAQTLNAYIANEKRNKRIFDLEKGEIGADAWRSLGVKYANKVKKTNNTGVKALRPAMPIYLAGTAGGPAWTTAGFITRIGLGLNWMLGFISAGITAAATGVKTTSMYFQMKANMKYLNVANYGLAIANEKMLEAQDERKTELAEQLEKIHKSLENNEKEISKLQTRHDKILGLLASEEGDKARLTKELHNVEQQLTNTIVQGLKQDILEIGAGQNFGSSKVTEYLKRYELNKNPLLVRLGLMKKGDPRKDPLLVRLGLRKKKNRILAPEHQKKLLESLERIQSGMHEVNYLLQKEVIDAKEQLRYTTDFYKMQAASSIAIAQETYREDLKFWMESGPTRARLLVIEADNDNLDQLAKSVLETSPIERLLVAGLNEELKPRFEEKLRELWQEKFRDTPEEKLNFEKKVKALSKSDFEAKLIGLCKYNLANHPELKAGFIEDIEALWKKTGVAESDIRDFLKKYSHQQEGPGPIIQELLQKTKTQRQSFEELFEDTSLKTLMGPHLFKEDLNLTSEGMSKEFGKYDTNIEEIFCFGKSESFVKNLDELGQNIQSGVPVFSIKSEPLTEADQGLWRGASKDPAQFLSECITGKSSTELIGERTETGGYKNVEMAEVFQKGFELEQMKAQMKEQKIPDEVIKALNTEDLDYFRNLLFEQSLCPGNITPSYLEKVDTKTASYIDCLAGKYIGGALIWNLVGNPKSTIEDMLFSLGNMALDGGGDLYRQELNIRVVYAALFQQLKQEYSNNGDPNMSPEAAGQKALVDAVSIFVKIEKLSKGMSEHLKKVEEWRAFGLDMANKTKYHNDSAMKDLKGSAVRWGAGITIGAVLLATTAVMPPAGVLAFVFTGMAVGGWQLRNIVKSTLHMRSAAGKYLPPANNGVARADGAAQEAQKLRKILIDAMSSESLEKAGVSKNIGQDLDLGKEKQQEHNPQHDMPCSRESMAEEKEQEIEEMKQEFEATNSGHFLEEPSPTNPSNSNRLEPDTSGSTAPFLDWEFTNGDTTVQNFGGESQEDQELQKDQRTSTAVVPDLDLPKPEPQNHSVADQFPRNIQKWPENSIEPARNGAGIIVANGTVPVQNGNGVNPAFEESADFSGYEVSGEEGSEVDLSGFYGPSDSEEDPHKEISDSESIDSQDQGRSAQIGPKPYGALGSALKRLASSSAASLSNENGNTSPKLVDRSNKKLDIPSPPSPSRLSRSKRSSPSRLQNMR